MTEITKEQMLQVLHMLTAKDDNLEWLNSPFNACGKTMASDRIILIAFPQFENEFPDLTEKISPLYPRKHQLNIKLYEEDIDDIYNAISRVPYELPETIIGDTCNCCNGKGTVNYAYTNENIFPAKRYERAFMCPACLGCGMEVLDSIIRTYEDGYYIKIRRAYFHPNVFSKILHLSAFLSLPISLVHQKSATDYSIFLLGDSIEILAMPCNVEMDSDGVVIYKHKI